MSGLAPYTMFCYPFPVRVSAKFGTCTVVSLNGTLGEAKMCTSTFESIRILSSTSVPFALTLYGASDKFSTNSHEMYYTVGVREEGEICLFEDLNNEFFRIETWSEKIYLCLYLRESVWGDPESTASVYSPRNRTGRLCYDFEMLVLEQGFWSPNKLISFDFFTAERLKRMYAQCTPFCTELVFVNLLRSPGIDFRPGGPVRQPYLTVPARQAK